MTVPIEAQVRCVERELRLRQEHYPRWIQKGKLREAKAREELEAMEAVLETLREVEQSRRLL